MATLGRALGRRLGADRKGIRQQAYWKVIRACAKRHDARSGGDSSTRNVDTNGIDGSLRILSLSVMVEDQRTTRLATALECGHAAHGQGQHEGQVR